MEKGRVSLVLEAMAASQGQKPIWIAEDKQTSYAEFAELMRDLALSLLEAGITKGDRVGIWISNRPEFTLVEMAANYIGAIGVPISTRYRSEELEYILGNAGIKILFMMDNLVNIDFFKVLGDILPELGSLSGKELSFGAFPELKRIVSLRTAEFPIPTGIIDFEDLIQSGHESGRRDTLNKARDSVEDTELSYIQYTSGSTGRPKGAAYTHAQVLTSMTVQGERWQLMPEDRMLIVAPFYHGLGHMAGPPLGSCFGCSIIPLEIFDAEKALEYIGKYRCTTLAGAPTVFQMMIEHPHFSKADLSSLRAALVTAAPSPEGLKSEIKEKFGLKGLMTGYGATETCGGCTQSKIGDPLEIVEQTIGFPLRTYEVKIKEPSTGEEMPPGSAGELCARGPCIIRGYFPEDETKAPVVDQEGWYHSGDLALEDERGYFKIIGRIKELIITAGNNVYPSEVENMLLKHQAVKEVQVIGVPDRLKGEVVMAYIICHEGQACSESNIKSFCQARAANYKVPQFVRFVDTFPVSSTGKILKRQLQEMAVKELTA